MKTYRRILVPTFSACPSAAQLDRCRELAALGDSMVRVVRFLDRDNIFESDGPAGIFPQEELIGAKVSDVRHRLDLLLARSGLGWAGLTVVAGDPQKLLAGELKTWQPDLVIVTRGWGHARGVVRAARQTGIPVPDIVVVAPDGLVRKLLNAFLPHGAAGTDFPLGNLKPPFHGDHHHAAS
jgi:hypothetical protein